MLKNDGPRPRTHTVSPLKILVCFADKSAQATIKANGGVHI